MLIGKFDFRSWLLPGMASKCQSNANNRQTAVYRSSAFEWNAGELPIIGKPGVYRSSAFEWHPGELPIIGK